MRDEQGHHIFSIGDMGCAYGSSSPPFKVEHTGIGIGFNVITLPALQAEIIQHRLAAGANGIACQAFAVALYDFIFPTVRHLTRPL